MKRIKTPLDVYKLLPRTNCRLCSLQSCFAFSVAVLSGEKELADCPSIDKRSADKAKKIDRHISIAQRREEAADKLRRQIPLIGLLSSTSRLGGRLVGGKLALKCLGKDFFIDPNGNVTSECHTHAWVSLFLLDYTINSKGDEPAGNWIPFREIREGAVRNALFEQLCEKPLKQMADIHTDLFENLIYIFSGDRSTNMFSSDISLILYPLPKVPILICYWKSDGDIESSLHIFFDSTVGHHLNIQATFDLGVGLAMMFEKVILKHKRI